MTSRSRVHDRELLDALEELDPCSIESQVWRVVRLGRDPARGSTANGRWGAPGEFEVLYTSLERDGALAEIGYRLGLEPIWPSKIEHTITTIDLSLGRVLDLSDFNLLNKFGISEDTYESHDYRTEQALSSAAKFLGFDGILVPNARHNSNNIAIYTESIDSTSSIVLKAGEPVDWNVWRAANKRRPSRRR